MLWRDTTSYANMVMHKSCHQRSIFRDSDQVKHNPAHAAAEAICKRLESFGVERDSTTKAANVRGADVSYLKKLSSH